jgi:hypothetical protein
MTYVEYLRVRRTLIAYTAIIAGIVAIAVVCILTAHGEVHFAANGAHGAVSTSLRAAIIDDFTRHHTKIPASAIFIFAAFGATIIASIFGTFLAREREHVPLSWTKPVSRERFALNYLAVDVIGIVAAFVILLVLGVFTIMWSLGLMQFLSIDAYTWSGLLLSAGVAFAYYGVVRAITVNVPGRAGAIAGASWVVGYILVLLGALQLPAALHDIVMAINYFNPLAYLNGVHENGSGTTTMTGIIPLGVPARTALVWLLAIVSSGLAITFYRRAEE